MCVPEGMGKRRCRGGGRPLRRADRTAQSSRAASRRDRDRHRRGRPPHGQRRRVRRAPSGPVTSYGVPIGFTCESARSRDAARRYRVQNALIREDWLRFRSGEFDYLDALERMQ